jgi:hypothetical protein
MPVAAMRGKPAIGHLLIGPVDVAVMSGFCMVRVVIVMNMLNGTCRRFVDMHDAHGVIRVRKAWRRERSVCKSERQGRH